MCIAALLPYIFFYWDGLDFFLGQKASRIIEGNFSEFRFP